MSRRSKRLLVGGIVGAALGHGSAIAVQIHTDLTVAVPTPGQARGAAVYRPSSESFEPAVLQVGEERPAGMSERTWLHAQATVQETSGSGAYVHAVAYFYAASGHLLEVKSAPLGGVQSTYWRAWEVNERGQVVREQLGNGVATERVFDPVTGALRVIRTGPGTASGHVIQAHVQELTVEWDFAGNVTERRDLRAHHWETYQYDGLHRLKQTQFTPTQGGAGTAATQTYTYGRMGRFTSRSDTGTYGYSTTGNTHAVRSLTNRPNGAAASYFCYDRNGNVQGQRSTNDCPAPQTPDTSSNQRRFVWDASNRLRQARYLPNDVTTTFAYTPDGARQRMQNQVGAGTQAEMTVYVGALYERFTAANGDVTHRMYIRAGGRVVAEEVLYGSNGVRQTRYWHRDHLDSITAITTGCTEDAHQAVKCNRATVDYAGGTYGTIGFHHLFSYASWGTPRNALTTLHNPANWLNPQPSGVYHRGYTGHEMLPDVGIIHMNGRVYLPEIGRFLSPDPFVQFPESTQNYNRYTYVGNNPLSYNDPSGYFISLIVAAVMSAGSYSAGQWATAMFVTGFLESGGSLKHAVINGISGGVGAHIGAAFQAGKIGFGTALVAQSITQGALSKAGGGRFGDGALGGALGFATGRIGPTGNPVGDVVVAAVAGGTVSRLTGGKFANGAISAAFSAAITHGVRSASNTATATTGSRTVKVNGKDALVVAPTVDYTTPFDTYGEAMTALETGIAEARKRGRRGWEYGGIAVERDGQYFISNIVTSRHRNAIAWDLNALNAISQNAQIVALHHYHPLHRGVVPRAFSDDDMIAFRNFRATYGEGFRAVYMMDRHGTRKFNDTTDYRGISCINGIASC